jgi:hypothetical protein
VSVDKIYSRTKDRSRTRDRRRIWMFRGCIFLMGRSKGGGEVKRAVPHEGGGFDPENAKPVPGQWTT